MAGEAFSVRSSRGHWLSAAAARLGLGQGMTMREFLRSPSGVGSAFPASAALVRAALDPVDFSAAHLVVEFGPGEGLSAGKPARSALACCHRIGSVAGRDPAAAGPWPGRSHRHRHSLFHNGTRTRCAHRRFERGRVR